MLTKGQEIIYRKDDSELCRLTADNWRKIISDDSKAGYIRYYQPFVKKENTLMIPTRPRGTKTSSVDKVTRKENVLIIKTQNSFYEVEYKGIDLEKVLSDGPFKGVNETTKRKLNPFPVKN
jgi:hypothetical protein